MQHGPTWQHVMLHDLPACSCVERKDGRDYARVTCPDCNGAGVLRTRAYNPDIHHAAKAEG